jgi:carbon-monoxide dehydrogenase iron sulfur subunit
VKRLVPDAEACRGCETCELVCAMAHENVPNPRASRIRVFQDLGVCQPRVCVQCADAKCVEACAQDAIRYDPELGLHRVIEEACIGCGACVLACPFGGVLLHPVSGKALICDLCGACVDACPFGALTFVEQATEVTR